MVTITENSVVSFPLNRKILNFCVNNFISPNPDLQDIYKNPNDIVKKEYKGFFINYLNNTINIHKGLRKSVIDFLIENKIEFEYQDEQMSTFIDVNFSNKLLLFDYQKEAKNKFIPETRGVVSLECGMGKTILALNILSEIKEKTLVLVHTKVLRDQWVDQIRKVLTGNFSIGQIGDGEFRIGDITVAIVDSLYTKQKDDNIFKMFGFVISDECHHIPADTFFDVITRFNCKYILGLSATPKRKDRKEFLLRFAIGDLLYTKTRKTNLQKKFFAHESSYVPEDLFVKKEGKLVLKKLRYYKYVQGKKIPNWVDMITAVTQLESRNKLLFSIIENCLSRDRKVLILSDRVDHCKFIFKAVSEVCKSQLLIGGSEEKHKIFKDTQVIVGTKVADEGMDVVWLDTLILTCPLSMSGNVTNLIDQRVGRISRISEDKDNVEVHLIKDMLIDFFYSSCNKIQSYLCSKGFENAICKTK